MFKVFAFLNDLGTKIKNLFILAKRGSHESAGEYSESAHSAHAHKANEVEIKR